MVVVGGGDLLQKPPPWAPRTAVQTLLNVLPRVQQKNSCSRPTREPPPAAQVRAAARVERVLAPALAAAKAVLSKPITC